MPAGIIKKAKLKQESFRNFKSEIDSDMAEIHEKFDKVSRKIKDNLRNNQNKEGLLTCSE